MWAYVLLPTTSATRPTASATDADANTTSTSSTATSDCLTSVDATNPRLSITATSSDRIP